MSESLPYPIYSNTNSVYNITEFTYKRDNLNENIEILSTDKELIRIPSDVANLNTNCMGSGVCEILEDSILIKKGGNYSCFIELTLFSNEIQLYSEIQLILFNNDKIVSFKNETLLNSKTQTISTSYHSYHNENDKLHAEVYLLHNENIYTGININITNINWTLSNV